MHYHLVEQPVWPSINERLKHVDMPAHERRAAEATLRQAEALIEGVSFVCRAMRQLVDVVLPYAIPPFARVRGVLKSRDKQRADQTS